MLERMDIFFENRLVGYDEHMITNIESASEFYKVTASQLPFNNLKKLKQEQNITDDAYYHCDTPLTVEHEMEILRNSGFSDVRILKNRGATYTLKAIR